jgi:hypothetical protein
VLSTSSTAAVGIDEGADDNALTMLTLPERKRKKRTLQPFFGSPMALI